MISNLAPRARTGLSPEWDHGFDEAFAELVSSDPDLVQAEFDDLVAASWTDPPAPAPPSPAPTARSAPSPPGAAPEPIAPPDDPAATDDITDHRRPPP